MIYQNLAIALAATSTIVAATPKPSYYTTAAITPAGGAKVHDNRGFVQLDYYTAAGVATLGASFKTTAIDATYVAATVSAGLYGTDFVADHSVPSKMPPTLFQARIVTNNGGEVHVHRGFKRTSHKQWSDTQTLSAPAEFKEQSYFGSSIAADQSTKRKLAVGCYGCNVTTNAGQVYLYSPSPTGTSWSQSQVITLGVNGFSKFGEFVELHDDVLLSSVTQTTGTKVGYVVYQRGAGEASPFESQQFLNTGVTVSSAAVYDDTIVLGAASATVGTAATAGEVHILYPSTAEFGLKPAGKPQPVQWSVQQILRASDFAATNTFGTAVAIDRNTISVVAKGAAKAYIFAREEKSGKWSQQQIFTGQGAATSTSVAGSIITTSVGSASTIVLSTQANWKCLVISLEDQFGDGWDTAELVVAAPDGTHDYFSLGCDGSNPRQLRYCPNVRSDEGVYSFSVPEAIKAKHYWELQYGIFDENKGVWYRGKWDTKMDFHWDSESLTFLPRKMDRARGNSTTCGGCPVRPTDKPTPVLRRNLKGGTHSPTISPAPTLKVSDVINWRVLTLADSGSKKFFDDQWQGTEYYVTDPHGHRLLHSGTGCLAAASTACWLDLPDGDYLLRLGGALDVNKATHTFKYCKMVTAKAVESQLSFRIKDGDCEVVTLASRNAVCNSNGYAVTSNFYLVLNVNMIVHGTTISSVTSAEQTVFSAAIASLFPGMQASDVSLGSVTPSGSSTFINANLRMSSAVGFDLLDMDDELAFESYLKESFSSKTKELSLAAALTAGPVASSFSHTTKVEFVDYRIVDSLETLSENDISLIDEVTSYSDSVTSSYNSESSSSNVSDLVINSISYSGYFLAALGIVLLAVFVIFKTQTSSNTANTHIPVPEESESPKVVIEKRQNLAKSTKALTASDLKELAQMEQEYLKIVTK